MTAKAVLGYDIVNKKLVINEKEANIVKFIFETYKRKQNYYQTAKICNEKGYTGKKGNMFHASSIKTIIQNQIYCGFNNFHINPKEKDDKTEFKKGKHKQIISKALYNKVNHIKEVA